jgi:hypothetical protein
MQTLCIPLTDVHSTQQPSTDKYGEVAHRSTSLKKDWPLTIIQGIRVVILWLKSICCSRKTVHFPGSRWLHSHLYLMQQAPLYRHWLHDSGNSLWKIRHARLPSKTYWSEGVRFWLVSSVHGVWLENEKTLFIHFKGIWLGLVVYVRKLISSSQISQRLAFFKILSVPHYKIHSKIPHCVLSDFLFCY